MKLFKKNENRQNKATQKLPMGRKTKKGVCRVCRFGMLHGFWYNYRLCRQ